jgi:iron(III) transport system permease protein
LLDDRSGVLTILRDSLRRWYLVLPVLIVLTGVLVPLGYLVLRAFQAEFATLVELVIRKRTLTLFLNTLGLTAGVLVATSAIALPMAWFTARLDFAGRQILTVLGVLPLAVPGYVMAYVLLATTGEFGTLAKTMGLIIPRLDGYDGALLALSLTTFPYLYLNLRTALLGLDTKLEETARSLGSGRLDVFVRVILPQLRPAFLAGGLLVGLHVLGDFGVVSLMRYETFSYALYLQYTASYDRIYAAWLALILLALTVLALALEAYLLKGLLYHSGDGGNRADREKVKAGSWSWVAYIFGGTIGFVSVGLPVLTVGDWMIGSPDGFEWAGLGEALWNSVVASVPAAGLSALLAIPIAYVGVRYESLWSRMLERVAYLGYATPRLAFALAWIVFVLAMLPWGYQTLWVLIFVYALHFMAEAVGPIRSALYQTSPSLEEAARSLGSGPLGIFVKILFPLLRPGILVSVAFVFLSAMKELPLTLLLAPPGFQTLATNTWSYAEEAMFGSAAPYALTIMLFSACFVGLLLEQE